MAYIEEEMRKRRGENKVTDAPGGSSKGAVEKRKRDGPVDIYEELYQIPDRLKVKSHSLWNQRYGWVFIVYGLGWTKAC